MRINVLKKLNENLPELLKYLATPIIRGKLTNNDVFLSSYRFLMNANQLAESEINSFQMHQLSDLLQYAYKHVPFYHDCLYNKGIDPAKESDPRVVLKELPIISKGTLIQQTQRFLSDQKIDSYWAATGGLTGKPLEILLDRSSIFTEKAYIYHFWAKAGYNFKKSKIATFRGLEFGGKIMKYNPLYNEIILNPMMLSQKNVSRYVTEIRKFGAEYIHGYPTAITHFCEELKKENIELTRIKAVFFISENVYAEQRKVVEDTLSCKTFAFYGHSERAVFAEQNNVCLYNLNPFYGFTELLPVKDDERRIICTGFLNRKMPLIRYDTGDIAIVKAEGLSIRGHNDKNVLIGKNDEEISFAAINFHSTVLKKINAYQFIQDKNGHVFIDMLPEYPLSNDDIENLRSAILLKLIGVIDFEIRIVDQLHYSPRGKLDIIIQSGGQYQ